MRRGSRRSSISAAASRPWARGFRGLAPRASRSRASRRCTAPNYPRAARPHRDGHFALAVAVAGGEVELLDTDAELIGSVLPLLERIGAEIVATNRGLKVSRNGVRPVAADVETEPFPGFPTDLQAQFMALMAMADGVSHIRERIFENRFMHVPELARMGADIRVEGDTAIVTGVPRLKGAQVMATDLRASVSLVLAGCRRGRDDRKPRLSSRPRFRENRAEALPGRGEHRTAVLMSASRLVLAAADAEDLETISARLQDAVAKVKDLV